MDHRIVGAVVRCGGIAGGRVRLLVRIHADTCFVYGHLECSVNDRMEPGLSVVEHMTKRDECDDRLCCLLGGESLGYLLAMFNQGNLNVLSR